MCDRVAVLRQGEIIANDSPSAILEAGQARLKVQYEDRFDESTIAATPEALAESLRPYGLDSGIEAVHVDPDTLEDVILALIQDKRDT